VGEGDFVSAGLVSGGVEGFCDVSVWIESGAALPAAGKGINRNKSRIGERLGEDFTSEAKAVIAEDISIAALKRCATQKRSVIQKRSVVKNCRFRVARTTHPFIEPDRTSFLLFFLAETRYYQALMPD
jgi:hypothetical protein